MQRIRLDKMITVEKYPYDVTGTNPNNRVENEGATINDDADRIIILSAGTFYNTKFEIRGVDYEEDIIYEEDYIFNYLHEEATERSGVPAYGVLIITNRNISGKVLISYQAVGGQYANIHDAIERAITDIQSQTDPIHWDNLIGVPLVFPPEPHTHVMDDLTGVDGIVSSLDGIAAAIGGEYPPTIQEIWDAIENRVPNTGQVRRSQSNVNWTVTEDSPLWIQVRPYPNAIGIKLTTWEDLSGASALEISGVLTSDGTWALLDYWCLYGDIPSVEMALTSYDGSSADLLIRSINSNSKLMVIVDTVRYYLQVPDFNYVDLRPLSEFPTPVPDTFTRPKYPWV